MARYSKAAWKPLPENSTQPKITPKQVILHSAVSKSSSLFTFFKRRTVVVESHFYIDRDGDVEQYMDTGRKADANRWGNSRAISVETWDDGDPDRTPWTAAQIEALAQLIVWISRTHGIPIRLCKTWLSPGVGYHVQFGSPGPWTPARKTCPGKARVRQVPQVISRAVEIANAPKKPKPASKTPTGGGKKYTVRPGDTLAKVGKRYGVTVRALAKHNRISDPNRVRVGQVLHIPSGRRVKPKPAPKYSTHRVKHGETLSGIASKYKTTSNVLTRVNRLKSANRIYVGQVLRVPRTLKK